MIYAFRGHHTLLGSKKQPILAIFVQLFVFVRHPATPFAHNPAEGYRKTTKGNWRAPLASPLGRGGRAQARSERVFNPSVTAFAVPAPLQGEPRRALGESPLQDFLLFQKFCRKTQSYLRAHLKCLFFLQNCQGAYHRKHPVKFLLRQFRHSAV